jgi:hypothetical protein
MTIDTSTINSNYPIAGQSNSTAGFRANFAATKTLLEELQQQITDLTPEAPLAAVATSGSYNDLTNRPALFSGSYDDLTNKPTILSSYNDLTNKPALFSGSYNDLTNKPTIPNLTDYATETYVDTAISNNNTIFYTVRVVENTSGIQETFEINGNKVKDSNGDTFNIVFQLGKTYRFNLSDSSNQPAALRFSTTPDTAVPASVTPYNENVNIVGTAGSVGSYIEITITENTPSVLYFYAIESSGTIDTSNIGGSVQHIFPKTCCYNGNAALTNTATAINVAKSVNFFQCGSSAALTLPAGIEGQTLTLISLGGAALTTMTITSASNQAGWSTLGEIAFNNVAGRSCQLQYLNGKWYCIGNNGAVFN